MEQDLAKQSKDKILELLHKQEYHHAHLIARQANKLFDSLELKQLLGLTYFSLQMYKQAKEILYQTVEVKPNAPDYNNLSLCERFLGNHKKAYQLGKKAIDLNFTNGPYFANLSTTAKLAGKHQEAITYINKAIELDPLCNSFYFTKGSFHFASGKLQLAEEAYRQGLRLPPLNEKYCVELFYTLASQKKYKEAWKFYEFRYNTMRHVSQLPARHNLPVLLEKKQKYEEKIAIIFEQGLGDNLMYLRFVPLFQQIAPNSYVLLNNENLNPFFENIGIRCKRNIESGTTHMLCMMSLPYHLDTITIPQPISCKNHNPSKSSKLKIGLAWAGSAYHPMDIERSTFLNYYEDFLKDDDLEIFSFMKDRRKRKRKGIEKEIDFSQGFENYKIIDLSDKLSNCLETANQFDKIDALVCVDTFTAHIAGTCGVPTYLIVSDMPDWRWGRKQSKSDWYPTVKIFRKTKKADYRQVIHKVYKEIKGRLVCP